MEDWRRFGFLPMDPERERGEGLRGGVAELVKDPSVEDLGRGEMDEGNEGEEEEGDRDGWIEDGARESCFK